MRASIRSWLVGLVGIAAMIGAGVWVVQGGTQAGGLGHVALTTPAGVVWTWGNGADGRLGNGATNGRLVPGSVTGMGTITAVAVGGAHTLLLDNTGRVWAFGDNAFGQIGDGGAPTDRLVPVQLALTSVTQIAAGGDHSLALRSTGELYAWGRATNGQLGLGTAQKIVPALTATGVSTMAAGTSHSVFVKTAGTAWAMGLNTNGQLGDGTVVQRTAPKQMSNVTSAVQVAAGAAHTLIRRSDNTVRATGLNTSGQLGNNSLAQLLSATSTANGLGSVVEIAAGANYSLARLADGTVRAWGNNASYQVGDNTTTNRLVPTPMLGLANIGGLGAGGTFATAVSTTGVVYMWGSNTSGEQGDGTITTPAPVPHAISGANYDWKAATPTLSVPSGTYAATQTVTVQNVLAGVDMHYSTTGVDPTLAEPTVAIGGTIAVTQSQTLKVKAWKAPMPVSDTATAVYTLKPTAPVMTPVAGTYATLQTVALSASPADASLYYTLDGTTPTSASTPYSSPFTVLTSRTLKAIAIKAGWATSDVATGVYTYNFGTLTAPTVTPAAGSYTTSVDVTMTSAQFGTTIRYTTDGSAPTAASTVYTAPVTLTGTTTLRAAVFHPDYATSAETSRVYTLVTAAPVLAPPAGTYGPATKIFVTSATPGATINYTTDGVTDPLPTHPVVPATGVLIGNFTLKAKAWKSFQSSSPTTTAVYTVGATPAIAASASHTLGLRADGTLFAWGGNSWGAVGDGTQTNPRWVPVAVLGVSGAREISAGDNFSLARLSDGRIMGWGHNYLAQLGDGTTTYPRLTPVFVSGITTAVQVKAGLSHSLARLADGTVRAWGVNSSYQLGDTTAVSPRATPVTMVGVTNAVDIAAGDYSYSLVARVDGSVWGVGNNGNGQLADGTTTARTTPSAIVGLTGVTKVAAGSATSYFLLTDGTLRAAGYNGNGQLGDGSAVGQNASPVTVSGLTNVVQIVAGESHAMALKSDGTVWVWGSNSLGQLGTGGSPADVRTPVQLLGLPAIALIEADGSGSFAVGLDAAVWAWGRNQWGQLGDGTPTNRTTPVQIAIAGMGWQLPAPVLSVAAGQYLADQTVTVTSPDTTATLRYTTDGSTPTSTAGTVIASGGTVTVTQSLTLKVRGFKSGYVDSVTTSAAYELKAVTPIAAPGAGAYVIAQNVTLSTATPGATIRYTTDGSEPTTTSTPYASTINIATTLTLRARAFKPGWTTSDSAAPSYAISEGTVATPTAAPPGGAYTISPLVTLASTTTGAAIRYSLDGTDPTGSSTAYRYPFVVGATTTVKARAFKVGLTPSAIVTAAYAVDAAGATATPTITPAGGTFTTRRTITIAGAVGATLRYTTTGVDPVATDPLVPANGLVVVDRAQIIKVRAWATGLNESAVRRADFIITGAIAAGALHSLALKEDGTVWAFGGNGAGQVGNNTATDQPTPVQVLSNVVAIAAGESHSLAVKDDGTLWTWGFNNYGQLGIGVTGGRLVPTQVTALAGVVAVAGGKQHSLAVKADGTVWAFGYNVAGALGDGTTTNRVSPVQVVGLTGVIAVAAGTEYSMALQSDASGQGWVWTFGLNDTGQLGDSTAISRVTPVRVPLGVSAVGIAAARTTAAVRTSDGRLFTWGKSDVGQLGTSSNATATTPQAVAALQTIGVLAAGADHFLARDVVGRLWAWGSNDQSRLGAGTSIGSNQLYAASPYPTLFVSGAIATAAGQLHSLLVAPDGRIMGAGANGSGQLGTGAVGVAEAIPVYAGSFSVATNTWLTTDVDGDGLAAWREYLLGTDPLLSDTNGNGINDGVEAGAGAADAANPDTDGDGLANWLETAKGTNPFDSDSDDDGVNDGADYYPLDPTRWQAPSGTPGDVTPPVITLVYPTGARPVP